MHILHPSANDILGGVVWTGTILGMGSGEHYDEESSTLIGRGHTQNGPFMYG